MPNKYSHTLRLLTEHTDANANLRLDTLLKFFQEASVADVNNLGFGQSYTTPRGIFWVLAKEKIKIDRLPKYNEEVTVRTWPGRQYLFLFQRHYEVLDSDGKCIIKATAYWSLIHIDTRKAIDPIKENMILPDYSDGSELPCPLSLKLPTLGNKYVYKPKFIDLDYNKHVNNTSYINIAQDLIPNDFLMNNLPKEVDIQWKKEVKLGDLVEIQYEYLEGAYCFNSEKFAIKIQY